MKRIVSFLFFTSFSFASATHAQDYWGSVGNKSPDPWGWHPTASTCSEHPLDDDTCDDYVPSPDENVDAPLFFFILGICSGDEKDSKQTQSDMRAAWSQTELEGMAGPGEAPDEFRDSVFDEYSWSHADLGTFGGELGEMLLNNSVANSEAVFFRIPWNCTAGRPASPHGRVVTTHKNRGSSSCRFKKVNRSSDPGMCC